MSQPVVLSSSSLSEYLLCGKKWEFDHVLGIRMAPSVRSTIGVSVHRAAEVNLTQKIESTVDLPEDVVLDVFSTTFDEDAATIETPEEPIGPGKDSGVKLTRLMHRELSPPIQPLFVEKQVQFQISGVDYSTYLDLVDREHRVRDLKTTQRVPDTGKHLLQMTAGSVGFRQQTGLTESDVQLDFLVRKKKPEYVPLRWGGPVSNVSIKAFADTVRDVHAGIMAGRFPMNGPQSYACGWCQYRPICPLWAGRKQLPQQLDIPPSE
jgi:CRISPR/Cas system-associated exonuclease Cas4 (RecB family)